MWYIADFNDKIQQNRDLLRIHTRTVRGSEKILIIYLINSGKKIRTQINVGDFNIFVLLTKKKIFISLSVQNKLKKGQKWKKKIWMIPVKKGFSSWVKKKIGKKCWKNKLHSRVGKESQTFSIKILAFDLRFTFLWKMYSKSKKKWKKKVYSCHFGVNFTSCFMHNVNFRFKFYIRNGSTLPLY